MTRPVTQSSEFTYFSDTQSFVAETSEFFRCDAQYYYNIAAKFLYSVGRKTKDVGFVMRSAKTGKLVTFTFSHTDKNNDGEIYGWNFVAKDLEGVTALLIND